MAQTPPADPAGLSNIKRVVVIMFENRSFDHVFGAFPGANGLMDNGQINQGYYNLSDPLEPPSPSNLSVYPTRIDSSVPQAHDFTHDFGDGMMPDLFGPTFTIDPPGAGPSDGGATYTSGFVAGAPTGQVTPTPKTWPETNSGFLTTYNNCQPQGQAALTYFEDGVLQVLHALASSFVLCDNWYCDMPGHTLPNRSFIHCATTGNAGIDDTDGVTNTSSGTIFEVIDQLPSSAQPSGWKMYAPVAELKGNQVLGQLDTRFLNSNVNCYPGAPITDFATDCQNGTLPFYSFIMCWLPTASDDAWTDTSMHPNSLVQPGENLLAAVYNTLRSSPCWADTLLVVTFDENGGLYDHVFPPAATPPDAGAPVATQFVQGCCGNQWILSSQFDFSLLGLRVPALLISPWLAAGIDSQPYQNTSVVRFLIDRMNAEFGTDFAHLTQRDASAPPLDAAFARFGQSTMRQDCPEQIPPYPTLPSTDPHTHSDAIPYSDGTLTVWTPPSGTETAPPVPYVQELLNIYVAPLPGHADSGKPVARDFATNAEVADYVAERRAAADRFYRTHGEGADA
jgi:phospholipase C